MAFDHVCLLFMCFSPVCPPRTLENAVEERKGDMGGQDCEGFVNCKVLRLCWKLQSSVWLCDTEIYSIGFQGIDYFHLCHSIPPGLSHLFLWHSLKAWSQKRTFRTMGLLSYSAFSDLLNSLLHHSAITPHPTFPDTLFSSNLGIHPCHLLHSTGAPHPSTPPLLILTLGLFLAYPHVSDMTLLHISIPEGHLYMFIQRLLYLRERGGFKRKYFSLSPSFISELKKKNWIAWSSFSKHLLLDVK